jgi:5'-3' exonuclease
MTSASRAFLIDASIYIFRAWFSLPDRWQTEDGWPLNAVYGYTRFLLEFLDEQRPAHCVAAFDESLGTCFRNEIYPGYKASRELPDQQLAFQLDTCRELTELLGLPCYSGERFEADDYLATMARLYRHVDIPVTIVSRDKDLGQLIAGDRDRWWDYAADVLLDRDSFAEKYGVRPEQFPDYLALVGDPVDDIPGIPGVGPKSAAALLQAFGDLEGLAASLDEVETVKVRGAARLKAKLHAHWPQVELARTLTGLESAIPGIEAIPTLELCPERLEALADYLLQLNLQGPLVRRCHALAESIAV